MKIYKSLRFIAFLAVLILSCIFFVSCKEREIRVVDRIILSDRATPVPEILIDTERFESKDFYFENKDGFVYVYEDNIYLSENAPDSFDTILNLYYKGDNNVKSQIRIIREKILADSIAIETESLKFYPGEKVNLAYTLSPPLSSFDGFCLSADKEEYVEFISDSEIVISKNAPLGETITLKASLGNGVYSELKMPIIDVIYDIETPEDLDLLKFDTYGYFKLCANIDLTGYEWDAVREFYGVLDGDGYTITGIEIEEENDCYVGLLINHNFGIVRNLRLYDCSVKRATTSRQSDYFLKEELALMVGGVCGVNKGEIKNAVVDRCQFKNISLGSVTQTRNFMVFCGGICGINYGEIIQCGATSSKFNLTVSSKYERAYASLGGLVGRNNEIISECYSYKNEMKTRLYGTYEERVGVSRLHSYLGGLIGVNNGDGVRSSVSAGNSFNSRCYGSNGEWTTERTGSFIGNAEDNRIYDCYTLYSDINALGSNDSALVYYTSSLKLSNCIGLSSEFFKEENDYLISNYEWKTFIDE